MLLRTPPDLSPRAVPGSEHLYGPAQLWAYWDPSCESTAWKQEILSQPGL